MVNGMGNLPIESITNGLLTLQKVRQLYRRQTRAEGEDSHEYVQPDRLSLMQEILSTVVNFIPQTRGASYSTAFNQGNRYSSAYRELKQHIRGLNRNREPDRNQILKTVKLLIPILDSRQRVTVDKILKIADILQS